MRILAIETSCDDTCIAILKTSNKKERSFDILSNIVSSQVKIHQKWGGVVPSLAKREHQKNLAPVLEKALKEANLLGISNSKFLISKQVLNSKFKKMKEILEREPELYENLMKFFKKYTIDVFYDREKCQSLRESGKFPIDAIAVTIGPGLEPCLWQGVNFARALAFWWNLPIIPINHVEAHIAANWLKPISGISNFQFPISKQNTKYKILNTKYLFPALCLVVSGGHTQLILMNPHTKRAHSSFFSAGSASARYGVGVKDFWKYKLIGETRDDAAGECFDKVARTLGLGYPGGPIIAKQAAGFRVSSFKFQIRLPRPMIYSKDYDFSFSGLKTAVLYDFRSRPEKIQKSKEYIRAMCAEIQQAVIDVLISKTLRAVKEYKLKTIMLGGGVAANEELRKQLAYSLQTTDYSKINFLVPPKIFCTDNAAMTAITAYFRQNKKRLWQKIKARANLRIA